MISYRSNVLGIHRPERPDPPPGPVRRAAEHTKRAPRVRYTWADDEAILAMLGKGAGASAIGRRLGRMAGSVSSAIDRLRRAGRAPPKAGGGG